MLSFCIQSGYLQDLENQRYCSAYSEREVQDFQAGVSRTLDRVVMSFDVHLNCPCSLVHWLGYIQPISLLMFTHLSAGSGKHYVWRTNASLGRYSTSLLNTKESMRISHQGLASQQRAFQRGTCRGSTGSITGLCLLACFEPWACEGVIQTQANLGHSHFP